MHDRFCVDDHPVDFHGDREYAEGGAVLVARSLGGPSPEGVTHDGGGGEACLGTTGHHGPHIHVLDIILGEDVAFHVYADRSATPGGSPERGDGILEPCGAVSGPSAGAPSGGGRMRNRVVSGSTCNPEDGVHACFRICMAPFGPGANGAYLVVIDAEDPVGMPQAASGGHIVGV